MKEKMTNGQKAIDYAELSMIKVVLHTPQKKEFLCEKLHEKLHDLLDIKDQYNDLISCDSKHRRPLDDRSLNNLRSKSRLDRKEFEAAVEEAKAGIIPAIEELYRDETPKAILERLILAFIESSCASTAQATAFKHYYGLRTSRETVGLIAKELRISEENARKLIDNAAAIVKKNITGLLPLKSMESMDDDDARKVFSLHSKPWSESDPVYADLRRVQKNLEYLLAILKEEERKNAPTPTVDDLEAERLDRHAYLLSALAGLISR